MRLLLTCILTAILGSWLNAQDCTIKVSGQVLDKATLEPLEFSAVALQEGNLSMITDSAGYFLFENVCPGNVHMHVYHIGCPEVQFYFNFKKDTFLLLYLEHHEEWLKEILVEGKPSTLNESQSKQSISSTMIMDQAGKSLADIVEQVPGVRTLRNGSGISKPIIHGLYGNRVAIINNGLLQAGQQWGTDHAPEIDPNAATTITVVKGSDAIEYGSMALGGALLVEAGPISRDPHWHGNVGYAFESNGLGNTLTARLYKSFLKLDWRFTGSMKKFGDHHAPDYFLTNTGETSANGSLQAIFRPNENLQHQWYYSLFTTRLGIFAGSHISNLTDLEEAIGRDTPFRIKDNFSYSIEPPKQHVVHHLLKYSGKNFKSENIFIDWSYGLQFNHRQEFDIRRGDRSEIPALDLSLWSNSLKFNYTNHSASVKYKFGMQGSWTENSNDYDTGILPLIPDYQEGKAGFYLLGQWPLGNLTLESGARYDIKSLHVWSITTTIPREIVEVDHQYHDVALSLGAQYKPESEFETRFQSVLARRSPEVNELYSSGLHQGVAGLEEGNSMLQSETSFKSMLTQAIAIPSLLRLELSVYGHLVYDYIYLKPDGELRLTIRGAFPVYKYTQEDAWIRGLDFVAISDFSHHIEVSLKASVVKGNVLDDNRPLTNIPPLYVASTLSWAFHDNSLLKGSRIQLTGEYTAEQKDWDPESELWPPPKDYFLLGVKFDTGIKIKSKILHAGISVENMLNTTYRDYLNRLRYFADEQGINFNLTMRYEF